MPVLPAVAAAHLRQQLPLLQHLLSQPLLLRCQAAQLGTDGLLQLLPLQAGPAGGSSVHRVQGTSSPAADQCPAAGCCNKREEV